MPEDELVRRDDRGLGDKNPPCSTQAASMHSHWYCNARASSTSDRTVVASSIQNSQLWLGKSRLEPVLKRKKRKGI
jgi:hypothetical protein